MKPAIEILLVSIGGAVGAAMRFGISRAADTYLKLAFPTAIFPVGTLIANVLGCFLIGMLVGSGAGEKSETFRLWFGVGMLGALTTFSTFGAETIKCASDGQWASAIASVAANLVVGLAAVLAGISLAKRFLG